jgi:hypothetical protein
MKYPTLTEMQVSRDWIDAFGGYNHNLRISDAEFYEMKNMTGDDYPILSPRRQRGIYWSKTENTNINGIIAKNKLCWVADGVLYINGEEVEGFALDNTEKQLISMGAYLIILPDKVYINTDNTTDKGKIEAEFTATEATLEMTMLDDGTYGVVRKSITPPTDEEIKADIDSGKVPIWIDTSKKPNVLKVYSTSNETWAQVSTTYTKIIALGIHEKFEVGDGVEISELPQDQEHLNGYTTIARKGDNYIVVMGLITEALTMQKVTVKRAMPDMDFVIESNNRLWGCRYFERDKHGNPTKALNEIYASKLGDFKNWRCYQGTAMDSYAVTVGTDGEFTGAATHLGYPIFFKENCMHKIYGNYPANYQVQTTTCRGVQKGCDKSIATVNEVLYYKARSGVCAYDGSLPVEVSSALGDITYHNAVAGALGNKYYISMKDKANKPHLFVYDTRKGMWHKEDNIDISAFVNCQGDLFFISRDTNQIMTVAGTGKLDDNRVDWEVVTGTMGTDSPDKKYISRIDVRMLLEPGSRVSFYAEYDSSGEWEHLFNMDGHSLKSFSVPVRPKRCDHMRLKIIGIGFAKIYSICKSIEWGSDK